LLVMGDLSTDLFDMFMLARSLRRHAENRAYHAQRALFLDAASALEAQAYFLARRSAGQAEPQAPPTPQSANILV
jgi:hypothetical protein